MSRVPFEALYKYPLEGNNFKQNGTHVFWPSDQNLFSKFYINMPFENETLYGISQQNFGSGFQTGFPMGTNDHLAFVKVKGPWKNHYSEPDLEGGLDSSQMDHETVVESLKCANRSTEVGLMKLKAKIDLYFKWYKIANIPKVIEQAFNPAQFPQLAGLAFDDSLEKKLESEMEDFTSDLSHDDYQTFEKTAFMCLHINTAGYGHVTEGNATGNSTTP